MTEPIINDKEVREMMAYHLRRALEDESAKGKLPPQLAKVIEESPDAVVESLVNMFTQAATNRLGGKDQSGSQGPLSQEDLQVLVLALSTIQSSHRQPADFDLDGALLFCNRGRKMLRNERYADAKRHFQRALQIKDNVKSAWEGLAEAQERLGEADNAAESRRRAVQL
jgi:tetratricopeptide (TPR) repeat protein